MVKHLDEINPETGELLTKLWIVVRNDCCLVTVINLVLFVIAPHKCYIGFRYAHPLTEDTLEEIEK